MTKKIEQPNFALHAAELLSMIPDSMPEVDNSTSSLKTTSKLKIEPVKEPKIIPVKKFTPKPAAYKPITGSRIFPCIMPKKYSNSFCIYRINFEEKFIIVKCKSFYDSVLTNMSDIDRKMRLGIEASHHLFKVVNHILKSKSNICTIEILFQPETVDELLGFESQILNDNRKNKNCLNVLFEPYIPKWISEVIKEKEQKVNPLLQPASAAVLIHNSDLIYSASPTNVKKKRLPKPKDLISIPRDRPKYDPEYISLLKSSFEKQNIPGNDLFISEFSYRRSIMDFLIIKGNIVTEVELKTNISDYWNDFQKLVSGGKILVNKHKMLINGKFVSNYFYFLSPPGVILLDEIPDHCGFIVATPVDGPENFSFKVIKPAPKLHSNFVGESFYKTMASALISAIVNYKTIIKSLNETINAKTKTKLNKNKPSDAR